MEGVLQPPIIPRFRRINTPKRVKLTREVAAVYGVPTAVHRRRTWLKTKLM
jgi:hypothetical protein